MPQIALPILKFTKKKETTQIMDVMTTDGRLVEPEIPVISSIATDENTENSFLINPRELYLCKDKMYHQLVSDKCKKPLIPSWVQSDVDYKKVSGVVVGLTYDIKRAQQFLANKKSDYMDSLKVIVAIGAVAFVLVAAMHYLWG
jgi:hypothetical protein